MEQNEILDTLSAAKEYLTRLNYLNCQLENAEYQIMSSSEETERNIESAFNDLISCITKNLSKRKQDLLAETDKVKMLGLKPLRECRAIISNNSKETEGIIALGKELAKNTFTEKQLEEFNMNAAILGCLPEVPDLNEVPYVTFQSDNSVKNRLLETCSHFGTISRIAPVQICLFTEKPGAILVEWRRFEYDDPLSELLQVNGHLYTEDRFTDIQEFRLQRAYGNVLSSKHLLNNFQDCYIGNENQFLVKDIQPNQEYSFRVCCKYEGTDLWSPWSLSQIAVTKINPFTWKAVSGAVISNENKIVKASNSPLIIYSDGPQFKNTDTIEFLFLECDCVLDDTQVGLCHPNNQSNSDLSGVGTFYVNVRGEIFIDGVKKSMCLPQVKPGSKISFASKQLDNDKIRISIDSNEKRVTYDWTIGSEQFKLFFYCKLFSCKSKVMIE